MKKTIHSSESAKLAELLREAREKAGLTQAQLAKKLSKPQSFVAKYEGGERRIDMIEFLNITEAIGANPVKIVKVLM